MNELQFQMQVIEKRILFVYNPGQLILSDVLTDPLKCEGG